MVLAIVIDWILIHPRCIFLASMLILNKVFIMKHIFCFIKKFMHPTRIFSKRFLYVWYNRNIDWFKYIMNITLINNCFCFWVRLKGARFCFFVTFYFLKVNLVTNSNSLNSDNKSISFFLTTDSVSLSCSSELKELKGSIL